MCFGRDHFAVTITFRDDELVVGGAAQSSYHCQTRAF